MLPRYTYNCRPGIASRRTCLKYAFLRPWSVYQSCTKKAKTWYKDCSSCGLCLSINLEKSVRIQRRTLQKKQTCSGHGHSAWHARQGLGSILSSLLGNSIISIAADLEPLHMHSSSLLSSAWLDCSWTKATLQEHLSEPQTITYRCTRVRCAYEVL